MTLKYHHSPNSGTWTRCVAQSTDACPFGGEDHADRTSIANQHGGGIVQDSTARETTVTPVIAGVYAVFAPEEHARTYMADGKLIPAADRVKYFKNNIAPKLEQGQSAKDHESELGAVLNKRLQQLVLPAIKFNDEPALVVRRAAPVVAGPLPLGSLSGSTPIGGGAPNSPVSKPRAKTTPKAKSTAQQSAKVLVREAAELKKKKARRRRKAIKNCRRAIRAFKAYDKKLGKVANVGGSSSGKGKSDFLDGFLDWFLDLFELD